MSIAVPAQVGMREAFAETMTELLREDPRVALLLADISTSSFEEAARDAPGRVINLGIREQLLVDAAAGMALSGMRPVAHTFASFLVERPFEQIKLGFNHQDVGGVLVSAGASYDYSASGRTHQAPGDVALIDTLGDWTVHVPGHPDELRTLLRTAVRGEGRVYLRTSTQQNARAHPVGAWQHVRQGEEATVIAVGPMLDPVLQATQGLDVGVMYASTVRPLDAASLRAQLRSPRLVVVEPYAEGTSAHLLTKALSDRPMRILSVGVPRTEFRHYGMPEEHARGRGLHPAGIRQRILGFLAG